ncbi:MAG: hypothetical protein PHE33_01990 [Bacteroidales bacterium]|nr:hypothetical protein [Bacteroidales bacterium]
MEFSFTKEPGIILIKHLISMMPYGVDMHVYFATINQSIYKAVYLKGKLNQYEVSDDSELEKVFEIRKPRKNPYSWEINRDLLTPIAELKSKAIQFNISNEDDHSILSMRFNSYSDNNNDVVFISFKPELSFFGIEGGRISMNTENKTLIANMLYKSSITVLEQAQKDLQNLNKFADKTKTTINSVKISKNKLKHLRDEHHRIIVSIAQNFISGFSAKYCVDFVFTDECIESLKNFSSNLPRLQKIVENAAQYAYNLNSFGKNKTIIIEEEYLEFDSSDLDKKATYETPTIKTESSRKPNKKERAAAMLDKIEMAVKRVMANKERITGVTVGKAFETPISAAAITDYLRKHCDEINEILALDHSLYPESRSRFRPLQNIIPEKKSSSKSA